MGARFWSPHLQLQIAGKRMDFGSSGVRQPNFAAVRSVGRTPQPNRGVCLKMRARLRIIKVGLNQIRPIPRGKSTAKSSFVQKL